MLIKKPLDIRSSEITSRELFTNRRNFIKRAGLAGAGMITTGVHSGLADSAGVRTRVELRYVKSSFSSEDEKMTSFDEIARFNNFYEFGTGKEDPARNAQEFDPDPWTITVEGLAGNSRAAYDVEDIVKMHPSLEERV